MTDFDRDYDSHVEGLRATEFPALKNTLYLDNAGIVPYATSLIRSFASTLTGQIFGNPHSFNAVSLLSSEQIDNVRLKLIAHFNADPELFDLVFVANSTAGIKLVAECLHAYASREGCRLNFVYHVESHTSLVGARGLTHCSQCLRSNEEVEQWICSSDDLSDRCLFAYPAQSNLTGQRLPLSWAWRVRNAKLHSSRGSNTFTLLDAASFLSTTKLDYSNPDSAPDFTVLSLHKIYGFPDLGAVLVRKEAGHALAQRQYFGGGTVEHVQTFQLGHRLKAGSLHSQLEDGTLPIHSIIALGIAMDKHLRLFSSFDQISFHTSYLAHSLSQELRSLRHFNGRPVCKVYSLPDHLDSRVQGPIIVFNIFLPNGSCVSLAEVEKVAAIRSVALRTGAMCNPGGLETILGPELYQLAGHFSASAGCQLGEGEVWAGDGRPLGVVRVSFGAANIMADVTHFLDWMKEFFVVTTEPLPSPSLLPGEFSSSTETDVDDLRYEIESLAIYPIKSCAGFGIPPEMAWPVEPDGLAWDREWCLIHDGTDEALSMKRFPQMTHLQPSIDLDAGLMTVAHRPRDGRAHSSITIPLGRATQLGPGSEFSSSTTKLRCTRVCGDTISTLTYRDSEVADFFTRALDVPCRLARTSSVGSKRIWKGVDAKGSNWPASPHSQTPTSVWLQPPNLSGSNGTIKAGPPPIRLSNESPILLINRASVSALHSQMQKMHQERSLSYSISASTPPTLSKPAGNNSRDFPRSPKVREIALPCEDEMVKRFRANIVIRPIVQNVVSGPDKARTSEGIAPHPDSLSLPAPPPQWSSHAYQEDNWCASSEPGDQSSVLFNPHFLPRLVVSSKVENASEKSSLAHVSAALTYPLSSNSDDSPLAEPVSFLLLGPCRRCQIVCVDSKTGIRDPDGEPFASLAKTRRQHSLASAASDLGQGRDGHKLAGTDRHEHDKNGVDIGDDEEGRAGEQIAKNTGSAASPVASSNALPKKLASRIVPGVTFGVHCALLNLEGHGDEYGSFSKAKVPKISVGDLITISR